ncbi:PREDICTED: uncharacterized protein LOC104599039 [Nelumbo nucifera]|uniref:Uncharacterized protein LOC104599039 n=1 Tax=Nelumbo nucifera TaxID=4432 RepID=A0A1U8AC44_NELNU|nr:PREDICTED: uncharacterized protein LOC104599039 [Nelumbo nucifera]
MEEFTDFSTDDMLRKWKEIASSISAKKTLNTTWNPPPPGFIELNFDGSSMKNPGPSGIGGGLRDENGNIIAMFSSSIGVGDSLRAQVLAALEGVQRAKDLKVKKLIVEGDSMVVVSWLKEDNSKL